MPANTENGAHRYAERFRARLPRRLQELREEAGLSKYALGKCSGVSREMISLVEEGESIPTFYLGAKLAFGLGMTLAQFVARIED